MKTKKQENMLLRELVQVARDEEVDCITGDILPENTGMRRVCERLGLTLRHDLEDKVVKAELML
jgi:acetyltransferase